MRETDRSADTKHKYDDIFRLSASRIFCSSTNAVDRQSGTVRSVFSIDRIRRDCEGRSKTYRTESRTGRGELERLDQSLQYLKKRLQDERETTPDVKITYFCADQKKKGGQYRTVQGKVRRIRQYEKAVELEDRTEIPIEDIVQILYNRF